MTLILQFLGCSVSWFLKKYILSKEAIHHLRLMLLTFDLPFYLPLSENSAELLMIKLLKSVGSIPSKREPVDCHGNIFGLSWSRRNQPCCHVACLNCSFLIQGAITSNALWWWSHRSILGFERLQVFVVSSFLMDFWHVLFWLFDWIYL